MGEKRFPKNSCYWSYLSISLLPISHCWIQTCFLLKKKKKVISGLENVPTWKSDWLSKARKQASSHQTKLLDLAHSAMKGNLLSCLEVQEEFSKNIFQALLPSRVIIGLGHWKSQNDSYRVVKLKVDCTQHIPLLISNNPFPYSVNSSKANIMSILLSVYHPQKSSGGYTYLAPTTGIR